MIRVVSYSALFFVFVYFGCMVQCACAPSWGGGVQSCQLGRLQVGGRLDGWHVAYKVKASIVDRVSDHVYSIAH